MTRELIDKAARAVAPAKLSLMAGDTDRAANRACYAMHDAALVTEPTRLSLARIAA